MIQHENWNIIQNKIGNEALKNFIRCTYAPQLADLLCRALMLRNMLICLINYIKSGLNIKNARMISYNNI